MISKPPHSTQKHRKGASSKSCACKLIIDILVTCRSVENSVKWDQYKHDLVQEILWRKGKQDRLIEYTDVVKMKGSGSWK